MASIRVGEACQRQQTKFVSNLGRMRKSSLMTDAVVVCGGDREFPVHRAVLCAASPFFETMFQLPMKENNTGRVELKEVSAEAVETVLDFVYLNCIPEIEFKEEENEQLLLDLIRASHLMEVNDLFEYSLRKFSERLNSERFVQLWKLAHLYEHSDLVARLTEHLAFHFDTVSANDDFLALPAADVRAILEVDRVKRDVAADNVLRCVLNWTKARDEDDRKKQLQQFVSLVNSRQLSSCYLNDLINNEQLIITNPSLFNQFVAIAFSRLSSPRRIPQLLCFGGINDKTVMTAYNVKTMVWSEVKEIPLQFKSGNAVASSENGDVYLINGETKDETVVYKYYPDTNAVANLASFKPSVLDAGAGVLNDRLYVVGGYVDEGQPHLSKRVHCIIAGSSGVHREVAATNVIHFRPRVFYHKGLLYAAGSQNTSERSLEQYNPATDQWTILTTAPGPVTWSLSSVYRGMLYTAHTFQERRFNVYDFEADEWRVVEFDMVTYEQSRTVRVKGMWSVVVLNSSAAATNAGGKNPQHQQETLLCRDGVENLRAYDPDARDWVLVSPPNRNAWSSCQTVVVNGDEKNKCLGSDSSTSAGSVGESCSPIVSTLANANNTLL